MKAILIDTNVKEVREIDITGDLGSLYSAIGCDLIESVYAPVLVGDDVMYVDEEGLFKSDIPMFEFAGGLQPFAGRAIIIGNDDNGESSDVQTPLSIIQDSTYFW
jgi:hypothetical protein